MRFAQVQILAAAILFACTTAASASDADFTLVNKTGYQVDSVYVGPSKSESWGKDILGRSALADGESVDIAFPHSGSECIFDIKVVYHDEDKKEWSGVDLCKYEKISIFWDGNTTRAVGE
jgi:hypothetical protein